MRYYLLPALLAGTACRSFSSLPYLRRLPCATTCRTPRSRAPLTIPHSPPAVQFMITTTLVCTIYFRVHAFCCLYFALFLYRPLDTILWRVADGMAGYTLLLTCLLRSASLPAYTRGLRCRRRFWPIPTPWQYLVRSVLV